MTSIGFKYIKERIEQMDMPVPAGKVSIDEWKLWAIAVATTRDTILQLIDEIEHAGFEQKD